MSLDKPAIRQHFSALRASLPTKQASQAAAKAVPLAVKHLAKHAKKGNVIACYHALSGEMDTMPLMEALVAKKYKVALPVIAGKTDLHFSPYVPGDRLERGPVGGIMQPLASVKPIQPDTIIVPLLAFDKTGTRLGMGGGFYDKTLAALRAEGWKGVIIGYGFACQQADTPLPREAHDITLDAVVTEKGVQEFR